MRAHVRLAFAIAFALSACARAGAQSGQSGTPPTTPAVPKPSLDYNIQTRAGEVWRCVAHPDFFREREGEAFPTTRTFIGKLIFHSASPTGNSTTGASIQFMGFEAPDMKHGNGLTAVVRESDTATIELYMAVDGTATKFATVPISDPVPFRLSYDDAAGTVTLDAAGHRQIAKPAEMKRGHFDMKCAGSDVSFTDFELRSD